MEKAFHTLRGCGQVGIAEPIVGVCFVDVQRGVGEGHGTCGHQPPHMVGVHVGDENVVHLLWLVACSLQIGQQLTQSGAE